MKTFLRTQVICVLPSIFEKDHYIVYHGIQTSLIYTIQIRLTFYMIYTSFNHVERRFGLVCSQGICIISDVSLQIFAIYFE